MKCSARPHVRPGVGRQQAKWGRIPRSRTPCTSSPWFVGNPPIPSSPPLLSASRASCGLGVVVSVVACRGGYSRLVSLHTLFRYAEGKNISRRGFAGSPLQHHEPFSTIFEASFSACGTAERWLVASLLGRYSISPASGTKSSRDIHTSRRVWMPVECWADCRGMLEQRNEGVAGWLGGSGADLPCCFIISTGTKLTLG